MAIRVALNHRTRYQYARDVWLSPQIVRLRPAPHTRTPIVSYSLKIKPAEHFINWQQDPYANHLARLVFPKKTREFEVEIDLVAEMTVINPFDFFLEPHAELFPFEYQPDLKKELSPYLEKSDASPKLSALVNELRQTKVPIVNFLVALNARLQSVVGYTIRLEPGIQTPEETMTLRTGSCRDSAWLFVQMLRQYGLAARFVSGYLIQLKADVQAIDGPSGASADFCDLHAWTEVYLPGAGWIGFDPTSGLMTGEGHIPLACSAEPSSAAAISGGFAYDNEAIAKPDTLQPADLADGHSTDVAGDNFEFHMGVTRLHEDPRVTKPYTDDQWQAINRLGMQVDVDLAKHDVRLTMGGEPTFVAIDKQDAPEWNSDALGDRKLELGEELLRRLHQKFAPGGFLHHGQGKWYPGEVLPRWAYGIYWRKDGKPIWKNAALIADPRKPGTATTEHVLNLMTRLADRLGVDSRYVMPGYEDAFYYAYRERRLPSNVTVAENHLASERERERLAKIFETGLDKEVGYALPLKKDAADNANTWISSRWFLRGEKLFLVPGDSPMGLRLPLDSIPWVAPEDAEFKIDPDPFNDHPPLADSYKAARGLASKTAEKPASKPDTPPAPGESAKEVVRTTLCVQARGGHLRVFIPPVDELEDYLELLSAIEGAAAETGRPVLIEGYTPSYDPRLNHMAVTPDPGVIEINTLPVKSWDALVRSTTTLYEEARQIRLGTEKFLLDGRHVGTGGGNHIVMGGEKPADSPFLRKPSLLKSMIGYWQNHPALSYLFSGMFVGPTSQAPRVDEARNDQIYELELAFKEIDTAGDKDVPPWLVDRIFRNLLIDSAGNTHRAEFCIDKLYSPDSPTGRLGLLEMRGFEMPPHPQMSLVQHLLLRALVSKFWQKPYHRPLVRWRTELHDRFMLPYFVRQDLDDVLRDLNEFGYPFRPDWFDTHFEFRFAHLGTVVNRAMTMEIRQAIEPWHVLGESGTAGGTVRYVDSSVERVQVLVTGLTNNRHVVTCNGKLVPLQPTGVNGEYVAGVRYRAWQPANCLQPTIPVHSPLTFDLIDTWNDRSIGGCTYHVTHPGGRSYDVLPINSYEAESRRINRFYAIGHTPGKAKIAETFLSKEFPFTLDLRHN